MDKTLVAAALVASLIAASAVPAHADPFPPQLPSAEEMARLQTQLDSTLKQVRTAQARLDETVRNYETAERQLHVEEGKLKALQGPIAANSARRQELEAQLVQAKGRINHRAASAYRAEGIQMVNVLLAARTFRDFLVSLGLFKSVVNADSNALNQVKTLRTEALSLRAQLEAQKIAQEAQVAQVARKQAAIDGQKKQVSASLAGLSHQFDAVRVEINKRKAGFAFPVAAPYSYVDTYGAPRMEGSVYFHHHEGTDIFAPAGTPLYAVVDGVIEHVGVAALGGNKLWLRSPGDNWKYYYAHLSGYAPGIGSGVQVRKGDVIGYVGNSGNAARTPPHVHFETRVPDGPQAVGAYPYGPPTNPYPILKRVDPLKK